MKKYVDIKSIVESTGLPKSTINALCKANQVPSYKFGGRIYFVLEEVEAGLKASIRHFEPKNDGKSAPKNGN